MKKYPFSAILFIAYSFILVKVMVFKSIPIINIGGLRFNFGGTETGHPANLVPFKTISLYLFLAKGWLIPSLNLIGNIVLLVPIGFLAPLIWQKMTYRGLLILAVGSGLFIELMQVVLRIGIFDIDDVILNALGVMLGYLVFKLLIRLKMLKQPT